MTLDLSGASLSSATIHWPRWGIPSADLVFTEEPTFAAGAPVILHVGDVSIAGTLRPGGAFGGTTYYAFIAGAAQWDAPVPARSYHATAGVLLSRVAKDLVRETGGNVRALAAPNPIVDAGDPSFLVLEIPDGSIGIDFTRRAGLASEALYALSAGRWWVDVAGVMHIGPRPARPFVAPPTLTVDSFDPSTLAATIRIADDNLSPLLPGCVLTAPGLPSPLAIDSLTIRATPGSIDIDACGERGAVELFTDLVASLNSPNLYARTAPMTVHDVQGPLASVVPIPGDPRSTPIPGASLLPQITGVPGCTATLAPGETVLVGWPGADPSSPTIVAYPPGVLPATMALDASVAMTIGEHSTGVSIGVGGPAAARVGDVVIYLYVQIVAGAVVALYVSPTQAPAASWAAIVGGPAIPGAATAGSPLPISHGSAKVTVQ